MGSSVKIDEMANEIMKGLTEYADLATDEMKSAVKKAGKTVKDEIKANAPKKTGDSTPARPRTSLRHDQVKDLFCKGDDDTARQR